MRHIALILLTIAVFGQGTRDRPFNCGLFEDKEEEKPFVLNVRRIL